MATEFHLPDIAPPGNTFPSRSATPTQALKPIAVGAPSLKLDTRQIVISVTAASSVEEIKPPPPAHIVDSRPSTTPEACAPSQEERNGQESSRSSPESGSQSSTATLVQEANNGPDERSPMMRSMFPQLNNSVPLSRQQYYPTLERAPPVIIAPRENAQYSPSLYSQPRSPPTSLLASDPWAASRIPSTIFNASPLRITEEASPKLSSPEQLLDLWAVSIGEASPEAAQCYTLGLKCDSLSLDHESLTLNSSSSSIYTLHASGSTVIITRTHPLDVSKEITVCNPTLSAPSVIHPELATFFPTLAELMAIDTASNIAASHRLPRQEGIRLQTEALDRARRAEAATLLWDSDSANYYLSVPSLHTSSDTSAPTAALPIEIITNTSIRLLNSASQPVLTLDLSNSTLILQTRTITSLAASTHTLDVLLSSILTLLLHLHRHTGLLSSHAAAPMPHFDPPPTRASPRPASASPRKFAAAAAKRQKSSSKTPKTQTPSRWLSIRNPLSGTPRAQSSLSHHTATTFPPSPNPSHAPTSLTVLDNDEDKDLEAAWPVPPVSIPTSGVAPELRGSNTGVDLSRFQAFDLDDPELSGGTKIALRFIYWAFGVVVWVLGVFIGCLAALVVSAGGCVGGKGLGTDG